MKLAFLLLSTVILATGARAAESYPEKPIRMISPYAPGGGADIGIRYLALRLQEAGWPAVVENKPGGAGVVGAMATLQSAADGYTLFQCESSSFVTNVSLLKDMPYDPLKDFAPITKTFTLANVLAVPGTLPAKNVGELVALAKAKTAGLSYASQGIGSGGHLLGAMFEKAIGRPLLHSPYKGASQAIPDVVSGRVDLIFASFGSIRSYLGAGTLRALAVASDKRLPELPNVPTMAEAGLPDVVYEVWFGLCAPAKTPDAVVHSIYKKVTTVLNQPDAVKRVEELGLSVETNTPEDFSVMIKSETGRLAKIIKEAGIKPR